MARTGTTDSQRSRAGSGITHAPREMKGRGWRDRPCLPCRAEVARMFLTRKLRQNDMQAKEEVYL